MRDSCDPGGYRLARGWRYTKPSIDYRVPFFVLRACFVLASCIRFFILRITCASLHPIYLCWHLLLCYSFLFCVVFSFLLVVFALILFFVFCFISRWNFVDVPLIFSCPANHVPDWQPRILLGMVEGRSVNVKNTHTHTHTHTHTVTVP